MNAWPSRPIEVANLLNPAFGALLLSNSVRAYTAQSQVGMNLSLIYLILPILLHDPTRVKLPRSTNTMLHSWVETNQFLLVGLPDRVRRLKPITSESLMFALRQNVLQFDDSGELVTGSTSIPSHNRLKQVLTDDAADCIRLSKFMGKWMAISGKPSTTLATWGLKP